MDLIYKFFNKNMNFLMTFLALFFVAVFSRFTAHFWNMTLVGSVAVVSGLLFKNRMASSLLVVSSLLVSDFFIGFHNDMLVVYFSFIMMSLISARLTLKSSALHVSTAAAIGSVCFYFITNFSVWLFSGMYAKNLTGLLDCYVLAIPFFRNQFFADIIGTLALCKVTQFVFRSGLVLQNNKVKNQEKLSLSGTSI